MFFKGQQVGRYRVQASLGSGGFGVVFLADDTWLGNQVALKVPHQQNASLETLLREPRLLAALDHPNIVRLLTVERQGDVFFIVMEYVDGETLADRIDRKGPLPMPEFLDCMRQLTSAVSHAHARQVLHRDLRPTNVMVTRQGQIKIADFGISRIVAPGQRAPTRAGSPPYMAPEQFEGQAVLASDLYALGVMMYEMLTGTVPVPDAPPGVILERVKARRYPPPGERNPAVPAHIERAVLKAMEPRVSQRFQGAEELMTALLETRRTPGEVSGLEELRAQARHLVRRERPTPSFCWNCQRPLAKRATTCAHCGEEV